MPPATRPRTFAFAAALLGALCACAPVDEGAELMEDGWQYRWGDSPRDASGVPEWARSESKQREGWAAAERPNMPPNRPAKDDPGFYFLWMRRQLPAPLPASPALFFPWVDQNFEVWLDGARVYAYGDLSAKDVLGGSPFHLVDLKPEDAGKTLHLRMRTSYDSIGVFGPRLGVRSALDRHVVRRGAPGFALGVGLLAGALLGCALFFLSWRDRRVALLAALSACCGVYSLTSVYSPIKYLLTDHKLLVWYLEFGSLFLLPACYFGFYEAIAPAGQKRLARWIWMTYVAFAVVAMGASLAGLTLPTTPWLGWSQVLLLLGMLLGIVMATRSALAGQGGAAIFLSGLVAVALAGAHDVLASQHVLNTETTLFVWGFLFFVGGLGVYVMRTYSSMLGERAAWEDQLRRRNQELTEARSRIEQAATRLTAQAQGILAAATEQAALAQQQAASNQRTHATVGEIESASRAASESALSVVETARRSEEMSKRGEQVVGEAVSAMENLGGAVDGIAREVGGLSERSVRIEEIIATVVELAEQTNLLALNAELQAAHSGEHGKGFAVVAGEMRRLAQQSKEAADHVRTLLAQIQGGTESVVSATQQGSLSAGHAVELARQAGQSITSLAKLISESSGVARKIAESAQGQTAVVGQIAEAVGSSSQALQSSAAGVRRLEDSARDLLAVADQLTRLARPSSAPPSQSGRTD